VLAYTVHSRIFPIRLLKIFRLPLLVSSLMLMVFFLLQRMSLDLLPQIALAISAYTILISFIILQKLGGLEYVRKRISRIR
jgi:hypothetical protein